MEALKLALKKQPIVYVARDLERALGLSETYEGYHIITNATPFAKQRATEESVRGSNRICLIESDGLLDTHELLEHPLATALFKQFQHPVVLVFKNTAVIENICKQRGYALLNPRAALSQNVEEKVSQIEWLGEIANLLPPHKIALLKECSFSEIEGKILQFNRAHTGGGTMRITDQRILSDLQAKFPERPVRITDFIDGPMLTNNNAVWGERVYSGPINYQITGLVPFTDRPFATIGNDWALPHRLLGQKLKNDYFALAHAVGKRLAKNGWKGLFGIDVILDQKKEKLYLIEINARQPASTTYESTLQQGVLKNGSITTFEAHLASLLGLSPEECEIQSLENGAQIIQRVRPKYEAPLAEATPILRDAGFIVTPYNNTTPGDDLLRIQSKRGLMERHGLFNEIGEFIATELTPHPTALKAVDLGFRADKHKLWELSGTTELMSLTEFHWLLTLPFWEKEGTDDWNLTPHEVLEHPEREPTHNRRIQEADLAFPICIFRQGGRWRIIDGLHRLCKAHREGRSDILVKIVTEKDIPLIRKQFN